MNKRANDQFTPKKTINLLIYHEWPEQIAHSCSFVISNLRDSLTVDLLTWAIQSQSAIFPEWSEQMSKEWIPNPDAHHAAWLLGGMHTVELEKFGSLDSTQGWEFAHRFSERIACFLRKNELNERFAQKNHQFAQSFIFVERPEQFVLNPSFLVSNLSDSLMVAHFWWATWANRLCSLNFWWATWAIGSHRLFLVSDLSDSLTSLIKKEGMSKSLIFSKTYKKMLKSLPKNMILVKNFQRIARFFVRERVNEQFAPENEWFAHLLWATWANYSQSLILSDLSDLQSLICPEQSERITHGRSFDLSNLST